MGAIALRAIPFALASRRLGRVILGQAVVEAIVRLPLFGGSFLVDKIFVSILIAGRVERVGFVAQGSASSFRALAIRGSLSLTFVDRFAASSIAGAGVTSSTTASSLTI